MIKSYTADELVIGSEYDLSNHELEMAQYTLDACKKIAGKMPEVRFCSNDHKIYHPQVYLSIGDEDVGMLLVRHSIHGKENQKKRITYKIYTPYTPAKGVCRKDIDEVLDLCAEKNYIRVPSLDETYAEAMDVVLQQTEHALREETATAEHILYSARRKENAERCAFGLPPDEYLLREMEELPAAYEKIIRLKKEMDIENALLIAELNVAPRKFNLLKYCPDLKKVILLYLEKNQLENPFD